MTAHPAHPAMTLPPALHAHLDVESLHAFWHAVRQRLERTGHAVRGTIELELDDDGADRLAGLLGRPLPAGLNRIRLTDLDAALRASAAGRGLVSVVAALTRSPLRDRPAERSALDADRREVWQHLDAALVEAGLADGDWVPAWTSWLHSGGVLTRLGLTVARTAMTAAVHTLAELFGAGGDPTGSRQLGELATRCTGSAHGLDDAEPATALVLRAAAIALGIAPATSAAERRELWQRIGVSTDAVSGTVITWGLRPPGLDRWSAMMRERAELGLVTHLTAHELAYAAPLAAANDLVHACENPQVLQAIAAAGLDRPVICTSGNPSAAGSLLLSRLQVRYHGDFDWPGIGIARRILATGALPWRFCQADYLHALDRIPADTRLPLTGKPEDTPWDQQLRTAMERADTAVHEEAIIDRLLDDLR